MFYLNFCKSTTREKKMGVGKLFKEKFQGAELKDWVKMKGKEGEVASREF